MTIACTFQCLLIAISLYISDILYDERKNHSHGNNASQSLIFYWLQKCIKTCMNRSLDICHRNLSFLYYLFLLQNENNRLHTHIVYTVKKKNKNQWVIIIRSCLSFASKLFITYLIIRYFNICRKITTDVIRPRSENKKLS